MLLLALNRPTSERERILYKTLALLLKKVSRLEIYMAAILANALTYWVKRWEGLSLLFLQCIQSYMLSWAGGVGTKNHTIDSNAVKVLFTF